MGPSWVAKVGEINTFIRSAERGVGVRWGTDMAYLLHIDTAKIHKSHAFIWNLNRYSEYKPQSIVNEQYNRNLLINLLFYANVFIPFYIFVSLLNSRKENVAT